MEAALENPALTVTVDEVARTANVLFMAGDGSNVAARTMNVDEITHAILTLGHARAALVSGQKILPLQGQEIQVVQTPSWYTQISSDCLGSILVFDHLFFGPLGVIIPLKQIPHLIGLLAQQIALPLPPEADYAIEAQVEAGQNG